MTTSTNRGGDDGPELVVPFSEGTGGGLAVLGAALRMIPAFLFGMVAFIPLWLTFLCLNQLRILAGLGSEHLTGFRLVTDPGSPWQVIACGIVLLPVTWLLGWLAGRIWILRWRAVRGQWWLRLSTRGFEVNSRLLRPRRYEWGDVDKFMLVTTAPNPEDAVLAPAKTFGQAIGEDGGAPPSLIVGFRYSARRRRTRTIKFLRATRGLRGLDGTKPDEIVMGWWDRPFDEAVDLMNDWLARYRVG
jgi:hypothetical protein